MWIYHGHNPWVHSTEAFVLPTGLPRVVSDGPWVAHGTPAGIPRVFHVGHTNNNELS